jgi:Ca-activated chloride channel family protein
MQITAHLDFDLVAVEHEDQLTLMLELVAPPAPPGEGRPPATVQVVLDRSGSMDGARLYTPLVALDRLVARLDESDRFGLVAFDDNVNMVVPAGQLRQKHLVRQAIASIHAGATTNLSGGYTRGLQEARRVAGDGGATVVLLSDGLANVGVCEPGQLEALAAGAQRHRITTTTLGLGLGYDEVLLSAIARGGAGNAHFAEEPDTGAAQIAGEIEGLLRQAAQAANLVVRPTGEVASVVLHNDLPATGIEDGVMIELGDLHHDETRRIVLSLSVPAMSSLGLAKVADLTLSYVELPSLTSHTIEVPVHVNVVPGDQAAGRIADPVVASERVFQQAQQEKRRAGEALREGDSARAAARYREAAERLEEFLPAAAPEMRTELQSEASLLQEMADRTSWDEPARLSKFTDADRTAKTRKRGRRPPEAA